MKESLRKARWKFKYSHRGIYRVLAAVALLSVTVLAAQAYTAGAMFDEADAVHIDGAEIPDTTLVIGTHLIWLDSLTGPLYQIALQSASDSGQGNIYYKSELGDGNWFEISGAGALSDITGEGDPISEGEIEALFLTHHTRADGITYSLKTGEPVNIFEISSPYGLLDMPELSELRNRYELDGGGGAEKLLEGFFKLDLKTEETERLDRQIDALYQYYLELRREGAEKEEADAVIQVADKLDARRRYVVYESLARRLEALLEDLGEEAPGQTEFQEAAGSCKAEVGTSQNACEARMFSEGETVLSKVEYEIITTLAEALEGEDKESGRAGILWYRCVRNIAEGNVLLIPHELALLNETLIPEGRAASSESGSQSALGEYKFFLAEKMKRLPLEEAERFLSELAEEAQNADILKWLSEQAEALAGSKNSEAKELYAEKELLLQEKKKALDQEQLAKVNEINVRLSNADSAIQAAEQAAADEISALEGRKAILAEDESEEAQIERARLEMEIQVLSAGLAAGSQAKAIQEARAAALEEIAAGAEDLSSLSNSIASIGALCKSNPTLCGDALKEIYGAMAAASYLEDASRYAALMEQTESILTENIPLAGQITEAEELGALLDEAEGEGAAQALLEAAIAAGPGASPDVLNVLKAKAEELAERGEGNVFREAESGAGTGYAPVEAVARYAGLRYIWNDSRKQAVLASKEEYYELSEIMLLGSTAYIPADNLKEQFGCDIVEIPETGFCMLVAGEAEGSG